ncbi:AbrB family transcriptional regulator [Ramlibacter sp. MMS24-I3-19]|uniref:AbrB family transcriptional regulator n=1 Tax=Ramlibacter sp. MMS24-I3-19 TaxID=3416606 RepID=UPI003D050105
MPSREHPGLTRQHWQWAALIALSIVLSAAFDTIGLPAGRLLGPMLAAIAMSLRGANLLVPRKAFVAAQGVIGALIARGVPGSIMTTLSDHATVFVAGVLVVTVLANGLGWMLSRWRAFPADTAIWGSAPGAASAMMIMAEAHGADVRLVAFMQYLRVVCVSFTASLVAHWWIGHGPLPATTFHAVAAPSLFVAPASWSNVAITLVLALGGAVLGVRLRLPAGALLVPIFGGVALQDFGGVRIELPPLALAIAYAFVGWVIGSRFNREVLVATVRSAPKVLAAIFTLIALCGCFGWALAHWAHVDPLTAYLATSPGGADTVAIIAASTPVDVPFVMTMQVLRMLFVMATGPAIARALSRRLRRRDERSRAAG